MAELSLLLQIFILAFTIEYSNLMALLQWTSLVQKCFAVVPTLLLCFFVNSSEDCLTCFNRFPENHFSRFQVRRDDNCIKKQTHKALEQKLLQSRTQSAISDNDSADKCIVMENARFPSQVTTEKPLLWMYRSQDSTPITSAQATGIFGSSEQAEQLESRKSSFLGRSAF